MDATGCHGPDRMPAVASPRSARHPGPVPDRTDFYRIRFDADPVQLIFFRHGLDRWLRGLAWPEPERVDAVLAVHEACTNAVQHAYAAACPGDVEVTGRLVVGRSARHLVIVVRDHGAWRPSAGAGLGLATVHACMEGVRIQRDAGGTVVTMTSRRVPLTPVESGAVLR